MSERKGRWTRLPTTNLFMQVLVYGSGGESRITGGESSGFYSMRDLLLFARRDAALSFGTVRDRELTGSNRAGSDEFEAFFVAEDGRFEEPVREGSQQHGEGEGQCDFKRVGRCPCYLAMTQ